ncbi:hypothetical protein MAPG_06976 [Magnaporthiopsis poae ATCC 64411]|uniref:Uncharacterized protein n=1 Tax=Magnaporthiopsis poae (strain ATCC 64411 / 73-15) TaxID=644358 RepID=A0A0C4E3H7_MAGP6|nr:hypothetical protein MAPG_06976 [Magnaporthiopsis poae ATCC 64411]
MLPPPQHSLLPTLLRPKRRTAREKTEEKQPKAYADQTTTRRVLARAGEVPAWKTRHSMRRPPMSRWLHRKAPQDVRFAEDSQARSTPRWSAWFKTGRDRPR